LFAFLGFEVGEELLFVFEQEVVHFAGDGFWVFGYFEVEDVGQSADYDEDGVEDVVGSGLQNCIRNGVEQFIQRREGAILKGQHVVVVALVIVKIHMIGVLDHDDLADQKTDHILASLFICLGDWLECLHRLQDINDHLPDEPLGLLRDLLDEIVLASY
jgi:hypothetical protein